MLKENASKEEMLENVEHSTENALKALTQFERSLISGRFKDGINSYQVLCNTLVGQKIWSSDKNNQKINQNFEKIASTAKSIVQILKPYVENLEKLTSVDGELVLEDVTSKSPENGENRKEHTVSDEEKIIRVLATSPKNQITYTKLRTTLGWERKKLDKLLNSLVEKESRVTINQKNSRKIVLLT